MRAPFLLAHHRRVEPNPLDVRDRSQIEPAVAEVMNQVALQLGIKSSTLPLTARLLELALTALAGANLRIAEQEAKLSLRDATAFLSDPLVRASIVALCTDESVLRAFDPRVGRFSRLSPEEQREWTEPLVLGLAALSG